MTAEAMTLKYQRLRAPKENGGRLLIPPLEQFPSLWQDNRTLLASHRFSVGDQDIHAVRESAQNELLQLGLRYTRRYRDVADPQATDRFVLAGHQPTLFHPGVWYKNFVLSQLARSAEAIAVNLVIDNDLCPAAHLSVPTGTIDRPQIQFVKYDNVSSFIPFERRQLNDQRLWESFGQRAASALRPLIDNPLISRLWPRVLQASRQGFQPEYSIAAGRHDLESCFGLRTLELPLSHVCETTSFKRFAAELISRYREFSEIHNQSLSAYRQMHRIRSQTHPVPALTQIEEWFETPFWIWRADAPSRRPLFVKYAAGSWRLADGADWESVPARSLVDLLIDFRDAGVSLRPRALITTMYSRLVLGELFLHGIGGAKYDQLTDEIIQRLFGVSAPSFLVVTATHRLPIEMPLVDKRDITQVEVNLRELVYHPERAADASDPRVAKLVADKRKLIESIPPPGHRRQWQRQIEAVNQELQALVEANRQLLLTERQNLQRELARQRIIGSREFSFCLFPDQLPATLFQQASI